MIITPSGNAQNNEPLRVRYLFRRWLSRKGVRVIVDLKDLVQLGVWEVGLLTSFKREVDQRSGVLRVCNWTRISKAIFKTTGSLASSISTPILKVRCATTRDKDS